MSCGTNLSIQTENVSGRRLAVLKRIAVRFPLLFSRWHQTKKKREKSELKRAS